MRLKLLKIQECLRILISCKDKPAFWHAVSSTLQTSPNLEKAATTWPVSRSASRARSDLVAVVAAAVAVQLRKSGATAWGLVESAFGIDLGRGEREGVPSFVI